MKGGAGKVGVLGCVNVAKPVLLIDGNGRPSKLATKGQLCEAKMTRFQLYHRFLLSSPFHLVTVVRRGDAEVEDQTFKRRVLVKAETLA